MKIKKFRIKPRLPYVGRYLKAILDIKKLPQDLETSLPEEIQNFLPHVSPAAFYHSWSQGEIPVSFQDVLSKAGLDKAVAVTAMVATIGSTIEEYLSELLMKGDTVKSQVVTAIAEESADLSFHFIFRLLIDDAKNDECEVSEPIFLTENSFLSETFGYLEADQEGVTLEQGLHLSPRFTRVALVAWIPANKKKRPAPIPKKKSH